VSGLNFAIAALLVTMTVLLLFAFGLLAWQAWG
jgi:hypothetical protein